MQDKALLTLYYLLQEDDYVTSEFLADQMHLGMRTVRKRIRELDDILRDCGAGIEAKPRFGYRLEVTDRRALLQWIEDWEAEGNLEEKIPGNNEERISCLLAYLLNQDRYIKSEDLGEFLCVSKGTLTSVLKQVEQVLNQYKIVLERRPNHGIRAVGREFDFRRCMGEWFVRKGVVKSLGEERQNDELTRIARRVLDCTGKYGLRFSEAAFERFVSDIYIQIRRIRELRLVDIPLDDLRGLTDLEWQFVREITDQLSAFYDMKFPREEQMYVALHLAGKRMVGCEAQNELNFVIREDIDKLAFGMLELIYEDTRIDFRGNFDLRMSLNQHLVPLDIRLRYDVPMTNPMVSEIKQNYSMGYTIASQAASVLRQHYKKEISEDEIGYLALIFALALKKLEEKNNVEKTSILVVCNSGKGISRLLMYRFEQLFDDYLDRIYVSNLFELENFDFSLVDYVFTTVPITKHIPVPIQEVGPFLEQKDIITVRKVLERGRHGFIQKYYKREHFLTEIGGTDREEILKNLCRQVCMHQEPLPGLYEAVMRREAVCSTDFGNLVAIPHPYQAMTEETFVYVAVLEEPVMWERYPVQVVILTLIGKRADKDIQRFYEVTTDFIADHAAVGKLLDKPDYDTLLETLTKR